MACMGSEFNPGFSVAQNEWTVKGRPQYQANL
jgi:hypothetical protein